MPPHAQEVMRCFAGAAELPSLDQVRPGEYPGLLVLDVTAEPGLAARILELRCTWLTSVLALAPDCETAERCLLAGAGDVVVTPWTPAEVRLRAHRLLHMHMPTGPLRAGDLVLNLATREVRTWQEQVCLTSLEYDLLTYLLRNADRVVKFDELLDAVWGYPPEAGDPAQVRNGVKRLRKKLGDDVSAPRYIATVRGVGYRWVAPLSPAPPEDRGPGRG
jgi:DNA-binding response OmpR family regulator